MRKMLLSLVALGGFALATPALAQNCETLEGVKSTLTERGIEFTVITETVAIAEFVATVERATGLDLPDDATAVLIASTARGVVFGVEVNGCLTPPALIPGMAAIPARHSGKTPFGIFA